MDNTTMHQIKSQYGVVSPLQRSYSFGQTATIEGVTNHRDLIFATYEALMQEYTRRSLGSPSDRLKAIKGFLNLITKNGLCRGVRFIHGLPAERFDLALLGNRLPALP
jgi:hypothetical protein